MAINKKNVHADDGEHTADDESMIVSHVSDTGNAVCSIGNFVRKMSGDVSRSVHVVRNHGNKEIQTVSFVRNTGNLFRMDIKMIYRHLFVKVLTELCVGKSSPAGKL